MDNVYKNCEIFNNTNLWRIYSKKFIPNHTLLNDEEKSDLLKKFY